MKVSNNNFYSYRVYPVDNQNQHFIDWNASTTRDTRLHISQI